MAVVPASYDVVVKVKSPREALAELRQAGKLVLPAEDIETIRAVTSGGEFAKELDDLVPADD